MSLYPNDRYQNKIKLAESICNAIQLNNINSKRIKKNVKKSKQSGLKEKGSKDNSDDTKIRISFNRDKINNNKLDLANIILKTAKNFNVDTKQTKNNIIFELAEDKSLIIKGDISKPFILSDSRYQKNN